MNPAEIVIHVVKRNRVFQVLELLGVRIGQARESAHGHAHREILALNVGRGNVVVIGVATNYRLARSHADCRAVAGFWPLLRIAVNLLEHRIINLCAKRILNCAQIGAVSVCCQLHAIRQTVCQIVHEVICAPGVTLADEPARNELGFRIQRNPCPNIARALRFHLGCAILFLGLDKAPDFITLQKLAGRIAKRFVLILGTGAAKIAQKLINGVARDVHHSRNRTHGISLDQCRDDLLPFRSIQLVHAVQYA